MREAIAVLFAILLASASAAARTRAHGPQGLGVGFAEYFEEPTITLMVPPELLRC